MLAAAPRLFHGVPYELARARKHVCRETPTLCCGLMAVAPAWVQALFWDAPRVLDDTIIIAFNTVTWLTVLMVIVFIFKVMYFNDEFIRTRHERGNSMSVQHHAHRAGRQAQA